MMTDPYSKALDGNLTPWVKDVPLSAFIGGVEIGDVVRTWNGDWSAAFTKGARGVVIDIDYDQRMVFVMTYWGDDD